MEEGRDDVDVVTRFRLSDHVLFFLFFSSEDLWSSFGFFIIYFSVVSSPFPFSPFLSPDLGACGEAPSTRTTPRLVYPLAFHKLLLLDLFLLRLYVPSSANALIFSLYVDFFIHP